MRKNYSEIAKQAALLASKIVLKKYANDFGSAGDFREYVANSGQYDSDANSPEHHKFLKFLDSCPLNETYGSDRGSEKEYKFDEKYHDNQQKDWRENNFTPEEIEKFTNVAERKGLIYSTSTYGQKPLLVLTTRGSNFAFYLEQLLFNNLR